MLAAASRNNPVLSTATVMLFFVMFNILEALIEKLVFGQRFEHWLDPFFTMMFISFAAYSVWVCAALNNSEKKNASDKEKR